MRIDKEIGKSSDWWQFVDRSKITRLSAFPSITNFQAITVLKQIKQKIAIKSKWIEIIHNKNRLPKCDRLREILEWKSAFKLPNLGEKKKHATCEEKAISLIITRVWSYPEKDLHKLPCWPLLPSPHLAPVLIGFILQTLTVKLSQIDNTGPFNTISQRKTPFRADIIRTNKITARHRTSYHHGSVITYKHGIYELSRELPNNLLPNDLILSILGN